MSIHHTAIITGDVQIDTGVVVEPYAVITGSARIHRDAYIGAHAVIGAFAQSHGTYPAPITGERRAQGIIVGAGACVREFATVHQGLLRPTVIGGNALVMAYCHVSHDSVVGNDVTMSTTATLGGFTTIGAGATLGQHAVTHPWVVIGAGAMVGLNTSVIRDVDPFTKVAGAPARVLGANMHKLTGDTVPEVWLHDFVEMCALRDALRAQWTSKQEQPATGSATSIR